MAHQRWHVKRPLIFFACDVDCPTDWLVVRQRIKEKIGTGTVVRPA